jgi:chaperonin GroEL
LDKLIKKIADPDEKSGARIVRKALEEPLRQLCFNAGAEGSAIVQDVLKNKEGHMGYNVSTGVFEDIFAAGVIDPTKVTREALQNAASISGLLLTTECIITELD